MILSCFFAAIHFVSYNERFFPGNVQVNAFSLRFTDACETQIATRTFFGKSHSLPGLTIKKQINR
jgi:hypothetical protein